MQPHLGRNNFDAMSFLGWIFYGAMPALTKKKFQSIIKSVGLFRGSFSNLVKK